MPPGGPGGSAAARSGLPLAMAAAAALSPRPAAPGARPAPLAARWVCLLSAQLQPNGVRAGTSQEIPILPPTHTSAARGWGWGMGPIGAGGGRDGAGAGVAAGVAADTPPGPAGLPAVVPHRALSPSGQGSADAYGGRRQPARGVPRVQGVYCTCQSWGQSLVSDTCNGACDMWQAPTARTCLPETGHPHMMAEVAGHWEVVVVS